MTIQEQLGNVALQVAHVIAWAVTALAAIVFLGLLVLYVVTGPALYQRGLLFVPARFRTGAGHLLGPVASTFRGWLAGRLISMTAVGLATTLGLWLLEIPYAVTLGLLAAMLGLIPTIGPLIAVVPAAVLAYTVGPAYVLYVLGLYLAISLAESFLLSPWIDKRTVGVPPALAIVGQLLAGALGGPLGLILATPVLALVLLVVRKVRLKEKPPRDQTPAVPSRN